MSLTATSDYSMVSNGSLNIDDAVVIYSVSALGGEEQYSRYKQKVVKIDKDTPYECRALRTNCKFRGLYTEKIRLGTDTIG